MRALAEFTMRGRLQASILALLSVPVISHGAIALVALRKGSREGLLMVLVALVPTLVGWAMGRADKAILVMSLLGLFVIYVPAVCLRATQSWAFALQSALLAAIAGVLLGITVSAELLDMFAQMVERLSSAAPSSAAQVANPAMAASTQLSKTAVSGSIVLGMLFGSLTGLLLARWWQALLYNPGGFGEEFRQIRLNILSSILYAAAMVMCYLQGPNYGFWTVVFAIPLVMVGLAILHSFWRARKIGREWLIALYILIVAYNQLSTLLLAALGFIDSWLNIRSRWSSHNED